MSRRRYLVCYDIRDPERLRDVHDVVLGYGLMFQYSVYICDLDFQEKLALRADLATVIHHGVDTVALIDLGALTSMPEERFEWVGDRTSLPRQGPQVF